ncbi:MAG: D-alanine--D-alanine ligase [Phycisphaerae bacterium]|nr:D-alanine--D-alanine ligase [Phycisphaerae bacterium]
MIVGLTYDLRADYLAAGFGEEETAEFDRPDTIDAIEAAIRQLGHTTERIGHVRRLVDKLAAGERWDLVFNIAEGLYGYAREAQVPALLDAYSIPYTFSDALVMALTLHKGMTKRVLRDLGVHTTDFRVVESAADVEGVDLRFPLFVKPVAEGTAKGITAQSRVTNKAELAAQCGRIHQLCRQPALVEPFLPGREFTVGITGTGSAAVALGTMEVVLRSSAETFAYTYVNKEQSEERVDYPLVDGPLAAEAEALSLATWRGLGCRDAGRVDLRADADGRLAVMEVNPLPGMHPQHSDLPILCGAVGLPYVELIRRILDSAQPRVDANSPRTESTC